MTVTVTPADRPAAMATLVSHNDCCRPDDDILESLVLLLGGKVRPASLRAMYFVEPVDTNIDFCFHTRNNAMWHWLHVRGVDVNWPAIDQINREWGRGRLVSQ